MQVVFQELAQIDGIGTFTIKHGFIKYFKQSVTNKYN